MLPFLILTLMVASPVGQATRASTSLPERFAGADQQRPKTASGANVTVSVETSSAKAVLLALQDPTLDRAAALAIARLDGNAAMIRKTNSFVRADEGDFADALVAAAHGEPVERPSETVFEFDSLRPRVTKLLRLVSEITEHPEAFQGRAQKRVALFAPNGLALSLAGHVIAGGPAGGFAFGEPTFYLNVGYQDDMDSALLVMTHELYHAVQGGALAQEKRTDPPVTKSGGGPCSDEAKLFRSLYDEGSAELVADTSTLAHSPGEMSRKIYSNFSDGLKRSPNSITLLELSATDLMNDRPLPFDEVYSLGFYGHSILYTVGYVMAKAIAESDGPQGLAALARQPGYAFVERYVHLPRYGVDLAFPKLGPNTIAAADHLSRGCP